MAQFSNNSLRNSKMFSLGRFARPLTILVLIVLVYVAGLITPAVKNRVAQKQANKVAKSFISNVTKGDYEAALKLGDANLTDQVPTADTLKELVGNLKADKPVYKENVASGDANYVNVNQVVDGFAKAQDGATDAVFNIGLSKIDGDWKVSTVTVN